MEAERQVAGSFLGDKVEHERNSHNLDMQRAIICTKKLRES